MDIPDDIRWKQRFNSFRKALRQLEKFIEKGDLNELEQQGLIKAFEYTYELAWNLLKDYLEYQGFTNVAGSRDTFRESYSANLVTDGDVWMEMLKSRNLTSHSYNQKTADEIGNAIKTNYYNLFISLEDRFNQI